MEKRRILEIEKKIGGSRKLRNYALKEAREENPDALEEEIKNWSLS